MDIFALLFAVFFLLFYVGLCISMLVRYVLHSLSLMNLSSRVGARHPWLAWIPVAELYVLGETADLLEGKRGISHNWKKILLILSGAVYAALAILFAFMFAFLMISTLLLESGELSEEHVIGPVLLFYLFYVFVLLAAVVLQYLRIVCTYKIFEEIDPKKSVKYILLTLLVPFGDVYCLSRCKNMIPMPGSFVPPVCGDPAFGYDTEPMQNENTINSKEQNYENHQQ